MKSGKQHSTYYQSGLSLVEILVGLVIGLLATLVIMQVFSVFEGQKRTTSGSADAQTNGSIALYTIANELKMAGFGLPPTDTPPLKCTTANPWTTTDMSPVTITDGGAGPGASDTITIRYATSASGGIPSLIIAAPVGNNVQVDDNQACNKGDVAMIVNGTTCNFTQVDPAVVPADTKTITLLDASSAVNGANISCLGSWVTTVFKVNPAYDPAVGANSQAYLERSSAPSVADIVNIQAQYGISASATSNQIVQWVDATGSWAAPTVTDRNRIKAIRVAVVARNGLLEKDAVTFKCTSLTASSPKGLCAWDATSASPLNPSPAPAIDLSNDNNPVDSNGFAHWQHYRYRVFETIIPLRNMIWVKDSL
jgi:type IV pilus assembly protein PilW